MLFCFCNFCAALRACDASFGPPRKVQSFLALFADKNLLVRQYPSCRMLDVTLCFAADCRNNRATTVR